jgi:serine/threonine protein phosphatase PrpC
MSLYGQKSYNNYHYNQKKDSIYGVLGTTFNPYQPKVSNQVTQEQYNQSLNSSLTRGKTPQKNQTPYENSYEKKPTKRAASTDVFNNNHQYNNNPYSRSPNFNTYVNGYSYNRDHVKDLFNLTGRDAISLYQPNKNNNTNNNDRLKNPNTFNKPSYSRLNQYERNPALNNMKVINNNESVKNNYNELNYKKNNNPYNIISNNYDNRKPDYNMNNNYTPLKKEATEKISNDTLEEYYVENDSGNDLLKNYAYKENANARFRDYMEDKGKSILNFNSDPDNALFCLFDGHGGGEVSKFLQDNFPKHMKESLPINSENYAEKLKSLFLKLDNIIKDNNFYQVGATACVVYITKENGKKILYCANVGDTRCTLIKTYKSFRLSYDDRASDENEYNRIIKEGGVVFGGRVYGQLMLSRAFGDWELKSYGVSCEPHVVKINIENDDRYVVIASDGVWDVLEDEDVHELSKPANNSLDLCRNIMKNTVEKGSMDNISCFVIELN